MPDMDWRSRRYWRRSAREWAAEEATAQERFEGVSGPERQRLEAKISALEDGRFELQRQVEVRDEWLSAHPEAPRRLEHLDREIDRPTRSRTTAYTTISFPNSSSSSICRSRN